VCPNQINTRINQRIKYSRQSGLGLPAAIFIITLMSVIAVAVNQLVSQNAQTFEEELNLTRAFYAAESGAGFVMNTVFPPEEYSTYATTSECVSIARNYDFVVAGLNQCSASVTCTPIMLGTGTTKYATIQSTGTCGDVERTVQIRTVY